MREEPQMDAWKGDSSTLSRLELEIPRDHLARDRVVHLAVLGEYLHRELLALRAAESEQIAIQRSDAEKHACLQLQI
jgi:putative heme iron utilization protein